MEIWVVGGGISGLSIAYALEREAEKQNLTVNVQVVEAANRLGGKIESRRIDGFVVEAGVNGWLDSKPTTDSLCKSLGIFEERLVSNDAARKRFLLKGGRLLPLPEGPVAFLTSRVMSTQGKFRLLGEPWARSSSDTDETVADFVRRRLGSEALETLLDPMVSGIFAGDPEQLSLQSAFPRIAEIEKKYGGLIRGLLKIQKERKAERKTNPQVAKVGPAPAGKLVSFASGTEHLVTALAKSLKHHPIVGRPVTGICKTPGGYCLISEGQTIATAEKVVVASPAYSASKMLADLDGELSRELGAIAYAAVAVVALAWKKEELGRRLDGFGFLIPSSEQRSILGTLWDSSVFSNRAPAGYVLTRTMVGGMRRPDLALAPRDHLIDNVRNELASILGVKTAPHLVEVAQHEKAIPQYLPGHTLRLQKIFGRAREMRGLFFAGNAYRGVGINDCTRTAAELAPQILA